MVFVQQLQSKYPKSYHYFTLFYVETLADKLTLEQFEGLDFMYQFGIFIKFFNTVSTDVDVFSNEENALKESINDSFGQYEEYLFLDS